jgi:hypothetical protein
MQTPNAAEHDLGALEHGEPKRLRLPVGTLDALQLVQLPACLDVS